MKFRPTAIPDVQVVDLTVFQDHRGFFLESWRADTFVQAGISHTFVQDSHSRSSRGVLRGMHYQVRQPQGKLVRVIVGEVFDVAVDLRRSSPTFGKWVGETLSASNHRALWIPPGFAHGFYVTSDAAEIVYKCTDFYAPDHERSLRWDDDDVGIAWPLSPSAPPILSDRDLLGRTLGTAECYP